MKLSWFRSISGILPMLVLLAVLPVLAIVIYTGFDHRRQSVLSARRDVLLLTRSMAEVLTGIHRSAAQILSTLTLNPAVQELDIAACTALFKALTDRHPEYLGLTLVGPDGDVLASNRPFGRVNLADRKHVREAMQKRAFATGEYIMTRVGKSRPSFSFAFPVIDVNGRVIAVLTAVLRLDEITRLFDVSKMPPDAFIAITDHRGIRLLYYPPKATNPIGQPIKPDNWQLARDARKPGLLVSPGSDGLERIIAYEPLREADGNTYLFVWAGIPEADALAQANNDLRRNLVWVALVTGIALAVSWLIGRTTLIAPIKALVAVTRRFGAGELDVRCRLPARTSELGLLARAFNDMAAALAASQQRLAKREAHLAEAQRIGRIGSWEFETAGERFTLSREMRRILALPPGDAAVPVERLAGIFSLRRLRAVQHAIERDDAAGKHYTGDLAWHTAAGRKRWLQVHGEISRDDAGQPAGYHGTALDITERIRAEQERQALQEQLIQSRKMESVGRLAGGVAHDFNNMLSIIIGHTELAMEEIDAADPLHTSLVEIHTAADRSADLVRQLLAFARKQNVSPRAIDLNQTVGDMLKMLRRLIGENIALAFRPAPCAWMVYIDPGQVDQILANLCVNARDAIDGAGRVTIDTRKVTVKASAGQELPPVPPGDYVELAVSDDGCGMDSATREKIFEPFFTTKALGKGTGLGLSTVFGIVKQNGGHIDVESTPGRGTTVRVYFPRHTGAADAAAQGAMAPAVTGGETILLVEDEPVLLQIARKMIERSGYHALTASTPRHAIELAKTHDGSVQLLLTDVIMPEMNGRELARRIEAICPGIKTLFMSGYTANVIARQGILPQDVNFIQKPFTRSELAVTIQRLMNGFE